MISHASTGLPQLALPTLTGMQCRWPETLGSEVEHQPEEPACPLAPIPPGVSPEFKLGEAARYNAAGLAVRALSPKQQMRNQCKKT